MRPEIALGSVVTYTWEQIVSGEGLVGYGSVWTMFCSLAKRTLEMLKQLWHSDYSDGGRFVLSLLPPWDLLVDESGKRELPVNP